jgi:hypothetical protein
MKVIAILKGAKLAIMGAAVFAYDMVGYGESQPCVHESPEALAPKPQLLISDGDDWTHKIQDFEKIRILREQFTRENNSVGLKELDDLLSSFTLARLKNTPAAPVVTIAKKKLNSY